MKAFALLLAVALLAGCQTQAKQPVEWPQLHIGPKAKGYIQVVAVQEGVVSSDLMKAGVRLYSTSAHQKRLHVRFRWYDADGFELPGLAANWQEHILRPGETLSIDRVAPGPKAVSFHIDLLDINTRTANYREGSKR